MVHLNNSTCVVITTKCTLNCKYCLNYQPYIEKKRHYAIENIIEDIDLFFKLCETTAYFSLTGGEPFLHPQFGKLAAHISKKYGKRIGSLGTAANCTVIPTDEICKILAEGNIEVACSRYAASTVADELVAKLRRFGVRHTFAVSRFFITYPLDESITRRGSLAEHYRACKAIYSGHGLKNGRLYNCCYSMFADTAGICPAEPTDYLELKDATEEDLANFHANRVAKGHVAFCKRCNGWPPMHDKYDPNGVTQYEN